MGGGGHRTGRTGARLSLSETVSSQEHGVMKGRASQLRVAAAVGQEVWGKAESSGSGEARARAWRPRSRSPGRARTGQGESGSTDWEGGDRRKAEGSVLMGTSPAREQVWPARSKPALGGCPLRRGFHPGIRGQDPPEALSAWALELRGVSWWTWGPEGASPP